MRIRLKVVLVALLATLLIVFAFSPLFAAGFLASDYAALLDGSTEHGVGTHGALRFAKPLSTWSLELSRVLWGVPAFDGHGWAAAFVRGENLVLHLTAALGLGWFTRRLLLPWAGSEQSQAVARASTLLFALHPLAVTAVADVGARGDLLGLALSTLACAAFLRGRQDRRYSSAVCAVLLAILAGLASDLALGIPPLLFTCEFVSSHRYRPFRVRARTALTTFVIFGAAVSVDLVFHVVRSGTGELPPVLGALFVGEPVRALQWGIEKLGLLVLPSNPVVQGVFGVAIAGTVFLLAMQPALIAARSAPRLWGWLLAGWVVALCVSGLLHADVRVTSGQIWLASALLPSVAVMCVGMALGSTALSGPRRPYIAWAVAVGYSIVAHGNARPWVSAAQITAELRRDLRGATDVHRSSRMFVLDPPGAFEGLEPVGGALAFLTHPDLTSTDDAARAPEDGTEWSAERVRGLSLDAFLAFVPEPEFAERIAEPGGLCVVYPRDAIGVAGQAGGLMRRPFRLLARAQRDASADAPLYEWTTSLTSPAIDLDVLEASALRVTLPDGVDPSALGELSWRTKLDAVPNRGAVPGVSTNGSGGAALVFDLGASLAWRLGGRVRLLVFADAAQAIGRATVLRALPSLGDLAPRTRGDDWVFAEPVLPGGEASGGRYFLTLLDVDALQVETFPAAQEDGGLRFAGANAVRERVGENAPIAWILDYRIGHRAVARTRGRR